MAAEKNQNFIKSQSLEASNKDDNAVEVKTSCWKSIPKCKINITKFLEKAKSYTHLVTEHGLLANPLNY